MRRVLEGKQMTRKIKAKTIEVLKRVRENYAAHKKLYKEAFEGYKLEAAELIQKRVDNFALAAGELAGKVGKLDHSKGHKPFSLSLSPDLIRFNELVPPVDHSSDYEVVIEMLQFETQDVIELDTAEFESYCMDRWDWKEQWESISESYAGKARTMNR